MFRFVNLLKFGVYDVDYGLYNKCNLNDFDKTIESSRNYSEIIYSGLLNKFKLEKLLKELNKRKILSKDFELVEYKNINMGAVDFILR